MKVTEVRMRRIRGEGKLKAVASITFDGEFVVHDVKVIEGQNGLFVAMPGRKMGEGDFMDIAHPLKTELRTEITKSVFEEYERLLKE